MTGTKQGTGQGLVAVVGVVPGANADTSEALAQAISSLGITRVGLVAVPGQRPGATPARHGHLTEGRGVFADVVAVIGQCCPQAAVRVVNEPTAGHSSDGALADGTRGTQGAAQSMRPTFSGASSRRVLVPGWIIVSGRDPHATEPCLRPLSLARRNDVSLAYVHCGSHVGMLSEEWITAGRHRTLWGVSLPAFNGPTPQATTRKKLQGPVILLLRRVDGETIPSIECVP